MTRLNALVLALMLAVAACGGSDDGSSAATSVPAGPDTTESVTQNDTTPPANQQTTIAVQALGDGNEDTTFYGNPPGTATVEIGEIRYDFDLDILCLSMFGAMGVAGGATDGSAVTVDADFPPAGWETSNEEWDPPSISIDDDVRDIGWQAGGVATDMYPAGSSQIDSFTADGQLAAGEATFVNTYTIGDNLQVETGRFEFRCPSE